MHNIIPYNEKTPKYHETAYIDMSARIIGGVVIGENSGIWPGAILRGDDSDILIDRNVNIMDKAFLEAPKGNPVAVGEGSLISHGAILHGCKIGKNVLVGIGAIVLDGAEVGDCCIIAAGSLVPKNSKIPPKSMVVGSPYTVVREVTDGETSEVQQENANTLMKARAYHTYSEALKKGQVVIKKEEEKESEIHFEPVPAFASKAGDSEPIIKKTENKLERKKKIKFQEIRFDTND